MKTSLKTQTKVHSPLRLNRQRHEARVTDCRSTNSVWIRQCGATKGRSCPNRTETEFYGGQSTSTKVQKHHWSNPFPTRPTSYQMTRQILISVSPKGTHHLWSMPILSYQDVTYHFRVSQSVSLLWSVVSSVPGGRGWWVEGG